MSSFWLSDRQKVGVAFCAGGVFFLTMGIVMFFDRAMLAMGNILFLISLPLLLGPQKTFLFFARPHKAKGTAAFAAGIILILLKWAFVGFLVEGYGIAVLFGDFMGTLVGYIGQIPVIGPPIRMVWNQIGGRLRQTELPV